MPAIPRLPHFPPLLHLRHLATPPALHNRQHKQQRNSRQRRRHRHREIQPKGRRQTPHIALHAQQTADIRQRDEERAEPRQPLQVAVVGGCIARVVDGDHGRDDGGQAVDLRLEFLHAVEGAVEVGGEGCANCLYSIIWRVGVGPVDLGYALYSLVQHLGIQRHEPPPHVQFTQRVVDLGPWAEEVLGDRNLPFDLVQTGLYCSGS